MATDRDMLEVVNRLYTAALGDGSFDDALCGLADFCGAESAALVRANHLIQHSSVAAPRVDPAIITAYTEHWWADDPTVKATQAAPVGRITSLATTGRDVFYQSHFHNEFWSSSGLGAERYAVNLSLGQHHFASCVLHAASTRDWLDRRAKTRLALFTPHLIRAIEIQDRLLRLGMANAMLSALQDTLHAGVIVVDPALRILFADPCGEALLAESSGVRFRHGAFGLQDARAHELLQRAVSACCGSYAALPSAPAVPWNRGRGAPPLTIEVVPWPHQSTICELPISGPAAILCILRPEAAAARQSARDSSHQRTSSPKRRGQTRHPRKLPTFRYVAVLARQASPNDVPPYPRPFLRGEHQLYRIPIEYASGLRACHALRHHAGEHQRSRHCLRLRLWRCFVVPPHLSAPVSNDTGRGAQRFTQGGWMNTR